MTQIPESRIELNPAALAQLLELEENGELLVDVLETYLHDAPQHIVAIQSCMAPTGGNAHVLEAIQLAAHTLKSTSATVGAVQLSSACKEIEVFSRAGDLSQIEAALPALNALFASTKPLLMAEIAKYKKS